VSPSTATATATAAPNDAAALFSRYKAATGGAAWDSIAAVATEGTLTTGGLTGSIQSLEDARTGRTVARFTLGPLKGAEGFDGTHPWEQDPGGEVTAHDAPDALELARTDVWLTAMGFLKPDFARAEVSAPQERVEGGTRYLVLDATPPGGRKIALWFDAQSSLLARTVIRRDSKMVTTVLSDYRDVGGGVRVAFHSGQDSTDRAGRTDPREHADVLLAKVTLNPKVEEGAFAMPEMAANAHIDDPSGVARVPFQLVNNHIYADGTIDGKAVRLLVDTGGANVLTPAAAARLGLKGEGKLAGAGVGDEQVDVGLAPAKQVRLGAAVLDRPVFAVLDMGALASVEGVESDGLVGFEMFRRFRVTVDYAARMLTLAEPAKFVPPPNAHVVPFELAERIPVIQGKLDGLPMRISVDTGSRVSLTVHSPFAAEHELVKRYDAATETVTGWGVGGPAKARPVRMGTLQIGDLAIADIAGDLYTGNKGAFASPDLSANLGGGVLKRFTVSFDYDARKMYLVPNSDFGKPDPFDRSGAWILADGDALKIAFVTPHGAAEKAGLKVGERILSVGEEGAKTRTVAEWRARFREQPAGTRVQLRVSDGTAARRVDLVLADVIPAHANLAAH
jgi:predicted aspartyl protease